jgi:hypothetical protein
MIWDTWILALCGTLAVAFNMLKMILDRNKEASHEIKNTGRIPLFAISFLQVALYLGQGLNAQVMVGDRQKEIERLGSSVVCI